MGRQRHTPAHYTRDALGVLASQIRLERTNRGLTQARLAVMAGCSPYTVSQAEAGSPQVSIGNVFDICTALGMRLFGADPSELAQRHQDARRINALIPQRVVPPVVDNDF